MHRNKLIITFIIITYITLYVSWGISAVGVPNTLGTSTSAQVEKYEMTITKFEVSYDSGGSYSTVFEGTATVDLASAPGSNTSAGTFFSSIPLSEGTITNVRVTFKSTFTIRGYVTYSGSTYRTTAGTNQYATTGSTGAGNAIIYDPSVGANGTYTIINNVSLTIGSGLNTFKITFNMTDALGLLSAGPTDYMIAPKEVGPSIEKIS